MFWPKVRKIEEIEEIEEIERGVSGTQACFGQKSGKSRKLWKSEEIEEIERGVWESEESVWEFPGFSWWPKVRSCSHCDEPIVV